MTPAGTSNELDVQNGWEENTQHIIRVGEKNPITVGYYGWLLQNNTVCIKTCRFVDSEESG